MEQRRSKINYYLDIAETVTRRGTCLRKNFGAVIVKDDVIVSTGYAGAPRGRQNCTDMGVCIREKLNIARGERYELCRSVHAEANAIISAARENMIGATLYLLDGAWGCGSDELAAPQATLMKMIIEGIMGGNLPWGLILIGVFIAIIVEIWMI